MPIRQRPQTHNMNRTLELLDLTKIILINLPKMVVGTLLYQAVQQTIWRIKALWHLTNRKPSNSSKLKTASLKVSKIQLKDKRLNKLNTNKTATDSTHRCLMSLKITHKLLMVFVHYLITKSRVFQIEFLWITVQRTACIMARWL